MSIAAWYLIIVLGTGYGNAVVPMVNKQACTQAMHDADGRYCVSSFTGEVIKQ